jgi:hypothetical protein
VLAKTVLQPTAEIAVDISEEIQMVIPFNGQMIGAVAATAAVILWLFFYLSPVLQGAITLPQFIVGRLYRRAQRAMYLAHAADEALVSYKQAEANDKSCPRSMWMEVCGR